MWEAVRNNPEKYEQEQAKAQERYLKRKMETKLKWSLI